MKSDVIEKQKNAIRAKGWDALISISPENVTYTLGFVIPSLRFLRRRLAAVVITANGDDALIVVDMEYESARQLSKVVTDIRQYAEFEQEMVDVLLTTIREKGLARGCIGIELDYLPARDFAMLSQRLPEARFLDAEKLFLELRSVKTPTEIEKLAKVSRASDLAHQRIVEEARVNMREIDLAAIIADTHYQLGISDMDTPTIVSGERSSMANDGPTLRRLRPGDLVKVDILAYVDGYCSDVGRTYVVGEPSREQLRIFSVLSDALAAMCAAIRPGVDTTYLYQRYAECFQAGGLVPTAVVGHGLGLSVHESPWISKHKHLQWTLQPGMVMCVETYTTLKGGQGYLLENTILVTDDGFKLLTDQSPSDRLLLIQT
ncbi:MAG: M24 family metallopeptidase [Anaerolineae bacterium]